MAVYTTINDPGSYFNTKLYTGTGASNAQTGVGFQPDFTWIKNRDATDAHILTDAVRGVTNYIVSDSTAAEVTNAESLKSFDSDGFTVGTMVNVNTNTEAFVAWNWKANGAGSSNTDGSITSTVSADTTAGFSIVSYTGTGIAATVGHGLGVAPNFIITKSLVATQEWGVYHSALGATKYLFLDEDSAAGTNSAYWNDVEPDSSVFTIGTSGPTNSSSAMIAYCFAEKQGYSKFGSYTGNGQTGIDGAFVYTEFRPAWIMVKRTNSAAGWCIFDSKREGYNGDNEYLLAETTNGGGIGTYFDILSNGFKPLTNDGEWNGGGDTYIYMAFAEQPLVNSNGVPTNAR